uniref:Uncharacterized protein n=1 Tax=Cannabis sativa TaxID=3483 RepID=A0A803Q8Z5_CANSA
MPLTGLGINSNTFATYPPIDQNSMNHNKGTLTASFTNSTTSSSVVVSTRAERDDKENYSPNRSVKRHPERGSLRDTLKRCRGNQPSVFTPTLSVADERNQHVSIIDMDSTGYPDNAAEAVFQPRKQP